MSKYHQLVKEYQNYIEYIKVLRLEADKAQKAGDYELWLELDDQANELYDALTEMIQIEYENVPYSKPRQAGIAGFWRESGLG